MIVLEEGDMGHYEAHSRYVYYAITIKKRSPYKEYNTKYDILKKSSHTLLNVKKMNYSKSMRNHCLTRCLREDPT